MASQKHMRKLQLAAYFNNHRSTTKQAQATPRVFKQRPTKRTFKEVLEQASNATSWDTLLVTAGQEWQDVGAEVEDGTTMVEAVVVMDAAVRSTSAIIRVVPVIFRVNGKS